MSEFFLTRGQFSMIDAVLAVLAQTGPGHISIWPRTVSVVKADILSRLIVDPLIIGARMIIASGDELKNQALMSEWVGSFGPGSVREMARTHCKIATVDAGGYRVLLRGSLKIGSGSRFEQLDITEGGDDYAMVERIELGLPSPSIQPIESVRSQGRIWQPGA